MVKLYKEWYLDADEDNYYVGRVIDGDMVNPAKYPTAAEAVNHVIEAELRQGVAKPDLLSCSEFIAMYSGVTDDVVEAVMKAPAEMQAHKLMARQIITKYRPQGVETRCKG